MRSVPEVRKVPILLDDLDLPEEEFVKKYGGIFLGAESSDGKTGLAEILPGNWLLGDFFVGINVSDCHAKLFLKKRGKEISQDEIEKVLEKKGKENEIERLRELVDSSVVLNMSGIYPPSDRLMNFLRDILAEIEEAWKNGRR